MDPAEAYRDRVDPKHKMAMDAIGFVRQLLSPHREQFENSTQGGGRRALVRPHSQPDPLPRHALQQELRSTASARACGQGVPR